MDIRGPVDGQQKVLERYRAAGGVAQFVFLQCGKDEDPEEVGTHRRAVMMGMRKLQPWASPVGIENSVPTDLAPQRISWQEFLGTRYDYERQGLIVRGKGEFLNEFFFYSDPACLEKMIPDDAVDCGMGAGFAYAFSDPPYGMNILPREGLGTLFDQFLEVVLQGTANLVIYQWPTDWSDYFADGREWWGTFLWTLSRPGDRDLIVIAASATD